MKLYDEANPAPNPRRVRIFLAEKGIDLPRVHVPLRERAHKSPEYMAKNSVGQVPALELDDGTVIAESVAICRYLDALHPQPPMFGTDAKSQALVDMWIRRIEFQLMRPISNIWVHAHPYTAKLVTQFTEFGEANRPQADQAYRWLDGELAGKAFVAGETYTMADIVALTTVDFGTFIGAGPPADCANLAAWHARVSARPAPRPEERRRSYPLAGAGAAPATMRIRSPR